MKIIFKRGKKKFKFDNEPVPFIVEIEKAEDESFLHFSSTVDESTDFAENYIYINQDVDFEIEYDLSYFLNACSFLNVSKLAKTIGVSESLLRQYASGNKTPSQKQSKRIFESINEVGFHLSKVNKN